MFATKKQAPKHSLVFKVVLLQLANRDKYLRANSSKSHSFFFRKNSPSWLCFMIEDKLLRYVSEDCVLSNGSGRWAI